MLLFRSHTAQTSFFGHRKQWMIKTQQLDGSSEDANQTSDILSNNHQNKSDHENTELLTCKICSFKANHLSVLQRHKIIHSRKMFKCSVCFYQTMYKRFFKRHMTFHDIAKQQKVKQSAVNSSLLPECVQSSQSKIFRCSFCSFETLHEWNLDVHKKTHLLARTSIKEETKTSWSCWECNYKTNIKLNFKLHMKKHIPYYRCSKCDFETSGMKKLMAHEKIHSEFVTKNRDISKND